MQNVEFEADNMLSQRDVRQVSNVSSVGMANWLIRHGLISSDSGAKVVLISFIAVNFIATALIMYFYVLQ